MKGRDVRILLHNKVDPALMKVIEMQAEEISEMQLQIQGLAGEMSKLAMIMTTVVKVHDGLERSIKRLANQEKQGVAVRSEEV